MQGDDGNKHRRDFPNFVAVCGSTLAVARKGLDSIS